MDNELLIRIDENVKYVKKALSEHQEAFKVHVEDDKRIVADFIKPLWETRQQDIGAANVRGTGSKLAGFGINAGIAFMAAWAAVKGLK